jgi:hypothetical protein
MILIGVLFIIAGTILWIVGAAMEGPPQLRELIAQEKGIMDNVHEKERQYKAIVAKIQKDCPEDVGDLSLSIGYQTWIAMAIQRFTIRQKEKNVAEQIKLLTLAKQYYNEYAEALKAKDAFERVRRGDFTREQDEEAEIRNRDRAKRKVTLDFETTNIKTDHEEEAEIRRLERENRRLTLQQQNAELKAKSAPRPSPPPAPHLSKIERVAQVKERAARNRQKYRDDPEILSIIDRQCDDEIGKILEGPD